MGLLIRRHDWVECLGRALDDASERVFEWGRWDCVHFVANIVEAMTGEDPLADYRGAYASEAEAWAVVSERDGNLRQACKRAFGGMTKPCFAKRGDVVMLKGGMAVGICLGKDAVFASPDGAGLVLKPMAECAWAFPLGWPEGAD